MKKSTWFLVMLALSALSLSAAVKMPRIFTDHMVLQRSRALNVWGWADDGEKVTVTFKGKSVSTVAANGRWQVTLPAFAADSNGAEMVIQGTNKLVIKDILVGDVWLCTGQSNMQWALKNSSGGKEAIARSANPQIRLFYGNMFQFSRVRQEDFSKKESAWELCGPASTPRFSGVGYFFGLNLQRELNVPVGLISVNWGGSKIEPWIAPHGFAGRKALKKLHDVAMRNVPGTPQYRKYNQALFAEMEKWIAGNRKKFTANEQISDLPLGLSVKLQPVRSAPSVMFNTMIAPLTRFGVCGVIWYQGCSNVSEGDLYREKMHALVDSWRKEFKFPEMPFYFVQIAPYIYKKFDRLPFFWEAQQRYADEAKHVAMAVITDIGNHNDIHPRNKHDVGRRLALLALKYTYGKKVTADSPFYASHRVQGNKVIVKFRNAEKLRSNDGKEIRHFEVAGKDGVFHPAKVELLGDSVILTAEKVAAPVAVRFGWLDRITTNLVNEAGLPAGSFRTVIKK